MCPYTFNRFFKRRPTNSLDLRLHSQTTTTRQPLERNRWATDLSLCTLVCNFAIQSSWGASVRVSLSEAIAGSECRPTFDLSGGY